MKKTFIGMPPGIGDLHWIMSKLESFKQVHNIEYVSVLMNLGYSPSRSIHDCSLEYLKLIPFIDAAQSVIRTLPFEYSLAGGAGTPLMKNRDCCHYLIEFNSQLEQGVKLANILPEYEINFNYPIIEPSLTKIFAERLREELGGKLVLIFTGGLEGNRVWVKDLWTVHDWMDIARKIYSITKCKLVLIGARWDRTYAKKLIALDREKIIHDLTGKTSVAKLFALLRIADLVVAYQCGVVNMGVHFRAPVAGFWPIKNGKNPNGIFNRKFPMSWLPPWAEEVGFMPFGFGDDDATPEGVLEKVRRYL